MKGESSEGAGERELNMIKEFSWMRYEKKLIWIQQIQVDLRLTLQMT